MLSHYSPLKVAETFRVLHALFPGRIDLGIGRAPGSDRRTALALAQGQPRSIERFPAAAGGPGRLSSRRPAGRAPLQRRAGDSHRPRRAGAVAPGLQRGERRLRRRPRLRLLLRPLHQPPAGRGGRRAAGVPRELPALEGPPRPPRQPRRTGPVCRYGGRRAPPQRQLRLDARCASRRVLWGPVPSLDEALAYPYEPPGAGPGGGHPLRRRRRGPGAGAGPPGGDGPGARGRRAGGGHHLPRPAPPGVAPTSCWRRRSGWPRPRRADPETPGDGRGPT